MFKSLIFSFIAEKLRGNREELRQLIYEIYGEKNVESGIYFSGSEEMIEFLERLFDKIREK
jgi:hypothetical protein